MLNSPFLLYFLISIILGFAMALLGQVLSTHAPDLEKLTPYECGFDPINSPRLPFSFRFFLVAILFLIFDLEIALLLVTPISLIVTAPSFSITTITLFLVILILGLYYEWVNGGLDWAEN